MFPSRKWLIAPFSMSPGNLKNRSVLQIWDHPHKRNNMRYSFILRIQSCWKDQKNKADGSHNPQNPWSSSVVKNVPPISILIAIFLYEKISWFHFGSQWMTVAPRVHGTHWCSNGGVIHICVATPWPLPDETILKIFTEVHESDKWCPVDSLQPSFATNRRQI